MNLIKIRHETEDESGLYVNVDHICRVYKVIKPRPTPFFDLIGGELSEFIGMVYNSVPYKKISVIYDEGIWNRFYLESGWLLSKDENTIVNPKHIIEIKEKGGVYTVYVVDKHHVSGGYVNQHLVGIEISFPEFAQLIARLRGTTYSNLQEEAKEDE